MIEEQAGARRSLGAQRSVQRLLEDWIPTRPSASQDDWLWHLCAASKPSRPYVVMRELASGLNSKLSSRRETPPIASRAGRMMNWLPDLTTDRRHGDDGLSRSQPGRYRGKICHLAFELREGAYVMDAALLVPPASFLGVHRGLEGQRELPWCACGSPRHRHGVRLR